MSPPYCPDVVRLEHGGPPIKKYLWTPFALAKPTASLTILATWPRMEVKRSHTSRMCAVGMPSLSRLHSSLVAEYPYSPPTARLKLCSRSPITHPHNDIPHMLVIFRAIPPPSNSRNASAYSFSLSGWASHLFLLGGSSRGSPSDCFLCCLVGWGWTRSSKSKAPPSLNRSLLLTDPHSLTLPRLMEKNWVCGCSCCALHCWLNPYFLFLRGVGVACAGLFAH